MSVDLDTLPAEAWLLALLSTPGVGPARLDALRTIATLGLDDFDGRIDREFWHWLISLARSKRGLVVDGHRASSGSSVDPVAMRSDLLHKLSVAAADVKVAEVWHRHSEAGLSVLSPDHPDWPLRLVGDPEPPPLLLCRGLTRPRQGATVAIVGTRKCSAYGREVATQLGRDLAAAGVHVVSGLAMGIDAAAHRGAIDRAGPGTAIGVLGAGFDRPVPQSNRVLYRAVCETGLVVSETPLGQLGAKWRFPARNRIIAAMADAVVVVESAVKGGSLYTVDEALRRDRPVFAVPGSVFSTSSAGTNRLLVDGAAPCLGAADVLDALSLDSGIATDGPTSADPSLVRLSDTAARVLSELTGESMPLDGLLAACPFTTPETVGAVHELEVAGWVRRSGAMVVATRRGEP